MFKTYLQWVGTTYYATASDFVLDVRKSGIIKRLPNIRTAMSLAKNPVAIFLAHNNGRLQQCVACAEQIVCPLCRGQDDSCLRCKGLGRLEQGTGGYAVVDGEKWSFVRYVKMKRNRRHDFWKSVHRFGGISWCKTCGGRGQLPIGEVFGFYVPSEYWYIKKPDDDCDRVRTIEDCGIKVFDKENSDHNLSLGGVYATSGLSDVDRIAELKQEVLVSLGKPTVEHIGGVVLLDEPFAYMEKQFRGIKLWNPPVLGREDEERDPLVGVA